MGTQPDPSILSQASRDLGDSVPRLPPAARAALRRRAEEFARVIRIADGRPATVRLLTGLTGDAEAASALATMLSNTLKAALSITGTDRGTVHLADPTSGALTIVVQAGFGHEFLDYFAIVDDDNAVCGRAARGRAQVVVEDVSRDPGFAPHREIAAAAGFRAVVSTPLIAPTGHVLGVVSTHFRRPHRPSARQLESMALVGELVGAALGPFLGRGPQAELDGPTGDAETTLAVDARAWLSSHVGGRFVDDAAAGPLLADLLAAYLEAVDELAELRPRTTQLQQALVSRVAIEQAKGIIAATNNVGIDEAFDILRRYARRHSITIHDTAAAVINLGLRP